LSKSAEEFYQDMLREDMTSVPILFEYHESSIKYLYQRKVKVAKIAIFLSQKDEFKNKKISYIERMLYFFVKTFSKDEISKDINNDEKIVEKQNKDIDDESKRGVKEFEIIRIDPSLLPPDDGFIESDFTELEKIWRK